MSDICPVCGLPKELCVCEEISKEQQLIRIRVERRKFGKEVTIIEGLNERDIDLHKLVTDLKSRCACGGTAKNGMIILQGDHKRKVKKLLVEWGFPESQIEVE